LKSAVVPVENRSEETTRWLASINQAIQTSQYWETGEISIDFG